MITYNVYCGSPLTIGHETDHKSEILKFIGFSPKSTENAVYLKLDDPVNKMWVLTEELTVELQGAMTEYDGMVKGQLVEVASDGDLIYNSPVFTLKIKRSIHNSEIAEVTTPTLDLKYAEMSATVEQAKEYAERAEKAVENFDGDTTYAIETANEAKALATEAKESISTAVEKANEAVELVEGIGNSFDSKVDKEDGKGLSSNDFTNADKAKLDGLENYDDSEIRADIAKKMEKHLLEYDGSKISDKGTAVSFADLYDILMNSEDFAVLVYNNYAYHPNGVSTEQIVFTASYPVNGLDVNHRITMLKNGTITKTDSTDENVVNKTTAITDLNKGSDVKYPTIKAVVDYVDDHVPEGDSYDDTEIRTELENKVDKVEGKGLSTNDFTDDLKLKLEAIGTGTGDSDYDDTELRIEIAKKVDKVAGKGLSSVDVTQTMVNAWNAKQNALVADTDYLTPGTAESTYQPIGDYLTEETYKGTVTSVNGITPVDGNVTLPETVTVTESTVSGWGFTKNTGTYSKPSDGIPKSDLSESVQSSLNKANTALQTHQDISGKVDKVNGKSLIADSEITRLASVHNYDDTEIRAEIASKISTEADPVFVASPAHGITNADISAWNNKQDKLTADTDYLTPTTASATYQPKGTYLTEETYKGTVTSVNNVSPVNGNVSLTIPSAVTEDDVSGWGFTKNTGDYSKPSGGIPKTDLASGVRTSLGKADTALQSYTETDPVYSASPASGITADDISAWNAKENTSNRRTSLSSADNNSYPTTKAVTDYLDSKIVIMSQEEYDLLTSPSDSTVYVIVG